MESTFSPRRAELLGATLRRFVRRGARAHIANLLGKTRPEDVALQLHGLTPAHQVLVFRILTEEYPESAGAVLTELEPPQRRAILEELGEQEIAALLEKMPVDDAVALVGELPAEVQDQVLELVDLRELEDVRAQLIYQDDTAGRIMDPQCLSIDETATVGEAIAHIQASRDAENVFYLYIVDAGGHLSGVTSLRQLLLEPPERPIAEVMARSMIKVHTDTDQEEVARLAARYDLLAIPVTDSSNRLLGIVTVDDIIDVVKEEATEDFLKMVGTTDTELVYQEKSLRVAGIRLPWLLINLVGLGAAGALMEHFQVRLGDTLFLLTFAPVVMGMSGNIGSQTSTIAVRGLATGQVGLGEGRARRFLWQQIKIGAVLGVACALLAAAGAAGREVIFGIQSGPQISVAAFALVVGVSLFLSIVIASFNGAAIPLLFERFGIDPAVAAGPLVTTSNDITGIVIYFGLASLLIHQLVQ